MNIQHPTTTNPPSWLSRTSLCAVLIISIALTGCETPGQSALLGAALGGGAGYVIGKNNQSQRGRYYDRGYRDSRYSYRDSRYDNRRYYTPRPSWRRY